MYQYLRHIDSNKKAPIWLGCTYVPSSFGKEKSLEDQVQVKTGN